MKSSEGGIPESGKKRKSKKESSATMGDKLRSVSLYAQAGVEHVVINAQETFTRRPEKALKRLKKSARALYADVASASVNEHTYKVFDRSAKRKTVQKAIEARHDEKGPVLESVYAHSRRVLNKNIDGLIEGVDRVTTQNADFLVTELSRQLRDLEERNQWFEAKYDVHDGNPERTLRNILEDSRDALKTARAKLDSELELVRNDPGPINEGEVATETTRLKTDSQRITRARLAIEAYQAAIDMERAHIEVVRGMVQEQSKSVWSADRTIGTAKVPKDGLSPRINRPHTLRLAEIKEKAKGFSELLQLFSKLDLELQDTSFALDDYKVATQHVDKSLASMGAAQSELERARESRRKERDLLRKARRAGAGRKEGSLSEPEEERRAA